MIPIAAAREPASFDARVRQRGLAAIAELVGKPVQQTRRGRKRPPSFASEDLLPSRVFPPFWREALDDLREAYSGRCAYLGLYIEHGTGGPSVDHFVPKAKNWRLVYEWSNYRLCAAVINACKGDREIELDPFTLQPVLFALEFTAFQVVPGPAAQGAQRSTVPSTIDVLGLNRRECCKAREVYVTDYREGPPTGISLLRLESRAPFIAQELRRQGLLVRGDR